jgi:hypothetical protein
MSETHPLDTELRDLWSHRRDLDEAGWTRLHAIAMSVLMNYKPRELAGLPEDRNVYIAGILSGQSVAPRPRRASCDHVGALRIYYQRYLRDLLRSKQAREKREVSDKHDPEGESPPSLDEAPEVETSGTDPLTELAEAGFPPVDVAASARAWLLASEEWVPALCRIFELPRRRALRALGTPGQTQGHQVTSLQGRKAGFQLAWWRRRRLCRNAAWPLDRRPARLASNSSP